MLIYLIKSETKWNFLTRCWTTPSRQAVGCFVENGMERVEQTIRDIALIKITVDRKKKQTLYP